MLMNREVITHYRLKDVHKYQFTYQETSENELTSIVDKPALKVSAQLKKKYLLFLSQLLDQILPLGSFKHCRLNCLIDNNKDN